MGNRGAEATPSAVTRALIVSSSAEARLSKARRWLGEQLELGLGIQIVCVTRGGADDLVRSVPGGAFGVERASLMTLAAELAGPELASRGLSPVSALGAVAIATRVAATLPDQGYFAPIRLAPGFPTALERTLRELRLAGVEPAAVAALERGGAELASLLEDYGRALAEAGLADAAEVLASATRGVAASSRLALPLLLLDVPPRSRAEVAFIEALARSAPAVLATQPTGDRTVVQRLESALGVAPELLADEGSGRLGRLRRNLFLEEGSGAPPEPALPEDGRVTLVSAAGEGRELAELAGRLRELAASGAPFDDLAVALREPGHLGLLEEACARAGIPIAPTRDARRPDPSGRAFLALLACAEEGLSASRFAEYLSLGQVPPTDSSGAAPEREVPWVEARGDQLSLATPEPSAPATPHAAAAPTVSDDAPVRGGSLRAPRAWERLLVDAAVIGGIDRWRRRLAGLLAELELRRRELDDDEPRREALERRIEALRRLSSFALPLVEQLAELPKAASWGTWIEGLSRLATRALRAPEAVLEVLAELAPMAAVEPVGLTEVMRVLGPRLSFLQRPREGGRYGRVFVGTIDELRGRSFHTVFVPGLADGVFPRRTLEDPLLLDQARRTLGCDLATSEERLGRERQLLAVALGAARELVVVSWSRYDLRQGRARTPSFYALDIARAASGSLDPLDELQARAAAAAAARHGWPAPVDPARALDDGDFDLSVVAELRRPRRPGEPLVEPGAGNYLLEVEPALARALTARGWRWNRELTDLDGLLARPTTPHREVDPDLAGLLAASHPLARPYSPTALQNYAACPYRFLLQAIHRLRPREEAEALESMDPLTRGSLFHRIQFEVLTALRSSGELPLGTARISAALEVLDQIIGQVTGLERDRLAPAIERVWTQEVEELRIDLRGWMRALATEIRWSPTHFELAFGLPDEVGIERDRASSLEPVEIEGGYALRGSIDLVESDGSRLRITDHKTGRAAAKPGVVVGGGGTLQPLLYGLVAERLLQRTVVAGRLWYATRTGGYTEREVPLDTTTRAAIAEVLEIIGRAVSEPFFPALPQKDACRWCDYRLVCGPDEERRVKTKRPRRVPAGLADLEALRGME